jgi:hypothetical protein
VYELDAGVAGEPGMGERRVIGHCSRAGRRVEPREGGIDGEAGVTAQRGR